MITNSTDYEAKRTAYLGPEASFSHQAAVEALPQTTPLPLPSFGAILKALQENWSSTEGYDHAVLPVENSTNGSVVQVLDLLAKCGLDPETSVFKDVEVIDEYYLEVHHCLFVSRLWAQKYLDAETIEYLQRGNEIQEPTTNNIGKETVPGNGSWSPRLEEIIRKLNIRTIYSHPQVWGQCNNILSALLPAGHVDRVDMSSTSAAAAFIADSAKLSESNGIPTLGITEQDGRKASMAVESGGLAAISSSLAGQKHSKDLICIARNIEDDPGSNTTRFFILRNRNRIPVTKAPSIRQSSSQTPPIKSLLAFTTLHDIPGSLAQALAIFAKCGFNLTAIQSRPRPKQPKRSISTPNADSNHSSSPRRGHGPQDSNWKYVFFVECLHTRNIPDGEQSDGKVQTLLRELSTATERLVLLGSWQDRLSQ